MARPAAPHDLSNSIRVPYTRCKLQERPTERHYLALNGEKSRSCLLGSDRMVGQQNLPATGRHLVKILASDQALKARYGRIPDNQVFHFRLRPKFPKFGIVDENVG